MRCSTDKQDLTAQHQTLLELGVDAGRIYLDHGLTGTNRNPPGLDQALAAVRPGDTLVVPKLDRLAQSVPDARDIGDSLAARGVALSIGTKFGVGDRPGPREIVVGKVLGVMVTDLRHYLDLPVDTPGPARRLAGQLSSIVRAATAGDAGIAWESALPCRRRPANRRCPGRMIVLRTEPESPLRWQCSVCDDEGVISNWADSLFDLRPRRLALADPVNEIIISAEVAAALRELRFLDADCERLVFRIRAHPGGAVMPASSDDLDELIGFVAAEANHESNRRRQQRLNTAFEALSNAAQTH